MDQMRITNMTKVFVVVVVVIVVVYLFAYMEYITMKCIRSSALANVYW